MYAVEKHRKKIKLENIIRWPDHRHGWAFCLSGLLELHSDLGTLFIDYFESHVKAKSAILEPWIGVIHNVPKHPEGVVQKLYGPTHDVSIDSILQSKTWKQSAPFCKGLFSLSKYCAEYLTVRVSVPVESVKHPTETLGVKFSPLNFRQNSKKSLVMVGHWMRNFQSIYDLHSPTLTKLILQGTGRSFDYQLIEEVFSVNESVKMIPRHTNEQYDRLLATNIVFLNLYDASASNTVIECIMRNTPVVVNLLPALVEYLGADYPLFYETIEQASAIVQNEDLLIAGHYYLLGMDKSFLSLEKFVADIQNSAIYRSLPQTFML